MANTELETLTITLNAEVGNARKNLNSVATSIKKLEQAGKEADWSVFAKIKEHLQGIANIDFTNVAQSLHDVVSAFKALGITRKEMLNMDSGAKTPQLEQTNVSTTMAEPDFALPSVKDLGNQFIDLSGEMANATQELQSFITTGENGFEDLKSIFANTSSSLQGLVQNVSYMQNAFATNKVEDITNQLKAFGLNAEKISIVLKEMGLRTETLSEENLRNLRNELTQLGMNAGQVQNVLSSFGYKVDYIGTTSKSASNSIRRMGLDIDILGSQSENSNLKFGKLIKQMGRIALYRTIRRAIQIVTQALKQGFENLAMFSEQANQTMSSLKSSFTMLKNSLASALYPLLESLAPIISWITQGIAEFNNTIGQSLAILSGKNSFAKATYQAEDYAQALKKVKNASLGIDELNVISNDQTGAMGFEEVELDKSIENTLSGIATQLTLILGTGTAIAATLALIKGGDFITYFTEIGGILAIIGGAIMTIQGAIDLIVNGFSWEGIIATIAGIGVLIAGLSLKFKALGATVGAVIGAITLLAIGVKELVDNWGNMGTWQKIIGVLGVIFGLIMAIGTAIAIATMRYADAAILGALSITGIATAIAMGETAKNGITFAQGGFPEDGFFFANHSELVGQFSNGKTAVANNEQITQGIHDAVLSALQEGGSFGGNSGDVIISLDGREIARAVNKQNANQGAKVFKGGMNYGN